MYNYWSNTESTVKCIYQGVQINTFYQYQECEKKLEELWVSVQKYGLNTAPLQSLQRQEAG